MQTVTIDILNDKAMRLLQDLELLQLIRMRREKAKTPEAKLSLLAGKLSEATADQILKEIEEDRNGWEERFNKQF